MMKKTLLCLAVGIFSFCFGAITQSLFVIENKIIVYPPVEEVKTSGYPIFPIDLPTHINEFPSQKEINKNFEIIEGDYDSQQNKNLWMYLYSTFEEGKPVVSGDVRVGSRIYDIKAASDFNPATGEFNFITKKVGKTHYKFNGKVIQINYKDGETVLQGKLEKIKNRVVVEVTNHKFKFYYHVCSQ